MVAVAESAGQPPDAVIVFVTVYVPAVLAERSTCPLVGLTNTKPAGDDVNVPALPPPLNVGEGSAAS
jgi:hypothetical protein